MEGYSSITSIHTYADTSSVTDDDYGQSLPDGTAQVYAFESVANTDHPEPQLANATPQAPEQVPNPVHKPEVEIVGNRLTEKLFGLAARGASEAKPIAGYVERVQGWILPTKGQVSLKVYLASPEGQQLMRDRLSHRINSESLILNPKATGYPTYSNRTLAEPVAPEVAEFAPAEPTSQEPPERSAPRPRPIGTVSEISRFRNPEVIPGHTQPPPGK